MTLPKLDLKECKRDGSILPLLQEEQSTQYQLLYLNSNQPFFLCLNTSFVFTNYQPIQRNASYNRTVRIMHIYCIMQHGYHSQILYINILVDWSLSGIMTSKLVIRESESSRPAASSILISRMTSSSVIIPYRIYST